MADVQISSVLPKSLDKKDKHVYLLGAVLLIIGVVICFLSHQINEDFRNSFGLLIIGISGALFIAPLIFQWRAIMKGSIKKS